MRRSEKVLAWLAVATMLSAVMVGGGVMYMAYVAGSIFWFLVGGLLVVGTLGSLTAAAIHVVKENKKSEE